MRSVALPVMVDRPSCEMLRSAALAPRVAVW